ncbi:hypothetical protein O3P69_015834 [Scylla paramamosain]|uniref:EF-hand domain-containing protein n=1 Tax=Scylla paramamosain TaxID=85552 RepID=A0AAW0T9M5_SCYPA
MRAERLFRKVCGGNLPLQLDPSITSSFRASFADLNTLPELKENPFRRRVCEVFGESPDGGLTFEQFLEMFSVFSESSPRDVKATYAFRVYDFDGDGFLGEADLGEVVRHLTHDLLSAEEYATIVSKDLKLSFLHLHLRLCPPTPALDTHARPPPPPPPGKALKPKQHD